MRQANNRSTRWVLVSFLLAISLLLLTWESTPPTTGTTQVDSQLTAVTGQEVPLQPESSSSAGLSNGGASDILASFSHKLSPVLRDEMSYLLSNPEFDYDIAVIVRVNPDLFAQNADLEGDGFSRGSSNALPLINSYMARLPAAELKRLLESGAIEYITLDAPIRAVEPVMFDPPNAPA